MDLPNDLQPPKDAKVIKTRSGVTWLNEDKIIISRMNKGVKIQLAEAKKEVKCVADISGDSRLPLLVDMRPVKEISGEARAYFSGAETYCALALLVDSPLSMLIANFFIGLNKTRMPTKLFTNETAAIKWLKGYLSK